MVKEEAGTFNRGFEVKWFDDSTDSSFEDGGVYCRAGEPTTEGMAGEIRLSVMVMVLVMMMGAREQRR